MKSLARILGRQPIEFNFIYSNIKSQRGEKGSEFLIKFFHLTRSRVGNRSFAAAPGR